MTTKLPLRDKIAEMFERHRARHKDAPCTADCRTYDAKAADEVLQLIAEQSEGDYKRDIGDFTIQDAPGLPSCVAIEDRWWKLSELQAVIREWQRRNTEQAFSVTGAQVSEAVIKMNATAPQRNLGLTLGTQAVRLLRTLGIEVTGCDYDETNTP